MWSVHCSPRHLKRKNSFENQKAKLFALTPNPVQSETIITFQIHNEAQKIRLKIVDFSQKEVANLYDGQVIPGRHQFRFETNDLAPGIYFSILESEDYHLTQKFVVVK